MDHGPFPAAQPGGVTIQRFLFAASVGFGLCLSLPPLVHGQEPDGEALFGRFCADCHGEVTTALAPAPEALAELSPESIVITLTNGSMRLQGSRIGGIERRAIAEYLTGRAATAPRQQPSA